MSQKTIKEETYTSLFKNTNWIKFVLTEVRETVEKFPMLPSLWSRDLTHYLNV